MFDSTILITTNSINGGPAPTIRFEYLPESVTLSTSATFEDHNLQFTSARFPFYQYSSVDEVSITVRVVAALANASFGVEDSGGTNSASGTAQVRNTRRADLISLARALYALTLPSDNTMQGQPPAQCNVFVGSIMAMSGVFKSMSITFNGPWDEVGAPTDMDVNFTFLPSEFYDSTKNMTGAPDNLTPVGSPTAYTQIRGPADESEYALTVTAHAIDANQIANPPIQPTQPATPPAQPTTPAAPPGTKPGQLIGTFKLG